MTLSPVVLAVALAGAACAALVAGALETYTCRGGLRPWPPCHSCSPVQRALLLAPLLGAVVAWRAVPPCAHHPPWRLALLQACLAGLGAGLAMRYGATPLLIVSAIEATLLLTVLFVDARHRLIPHGLVLLGASLALASSPLWPGLGLFSSLGGGVGAFVLFTLLARLAARAFGEGAFGQGDANLAGWIGLLSGYPLGIISLSAGVCLGGLGALALIVLRRGDMRATMPYGPYLVAGALYVLLLGNTLTPIATYL